MDRTQGSFAIKRLAQELRDLQREASPEYYAAPINVIIFYFIYRMICFNGILLLEDLRILLLRMAITMAT